jgi:hypothetical protein
VYAMGGCDSVYEHNTTERYDYKMNQWSIIAPMNMKRLHASATALNGKMNTIKWEGIHKKCVTECIICRSYLSISVPTF